MFFAGPGCGRVNAGAEELLTVRRHAQTRENTLPATSSDTAFRSRSRALSYRPRHLQQGVYSSCVLFSLPSPSSPLAQGLSRSRIHAYNLFPQHLRSITIDRARHALRHFPWYLPHSYTRCLSTPLRLCHTSEPRQFSYASIRLVVSTLRHVSLKILTLHLSERPREMQKQRPEIHSSRERLVRIL